MKTSNYFLKLIKYASIFISAYTTFADIYPAPNGFRRLILNGYRFGERGTSSGGFDPIPNQFWQCTANIRDIKTGKLKRCPVRIRTKVIDGYEMIYDTIVKHYHKPAEIN